jgi:hypothetical protein
MPIIPGRDPNEAYEIIPTDEHRRGPRGGWWTVTCNGIPVHHFGPDRRDVAERYATDPNYRLAQMKTKLWERGSRWPADAAKDLSGFVKSIPSDRGREITLAAAAIRPGAAAL